MTSPVVQIRSETLLHHLLEGTASKTGHEFFKALVRSAALALNVTGVWITEYLPERRVLRSIAFWLNGEYIEDYEYKIDGTPCGIVIDEARLVYYPERIVDLFPEDPDLVALNAVSYLGAPILKSNGSVLGHLSSMDTKPMKLEPELESVFRIFAARAGAELNRIRAENKIRESEQRFSGLFESAMDAIFELDEEFAIQRANGSAATLFVSPGESLAGKKVTSFLSPASAQKLCAVVHDLGAEAKQYAWVPGGLDAINSNGTAFAAEASVSRFDVQERRRFRRCQELQADVGETEFSKRRTADG
jgi:PAS domain S-box-containing protein